MLLPLVGAMTTPAPGMGLAEKWELLPLVGAMTTGRRANRISPVAAPRGDDTGPQPLDHSTSVKGGQHGDAGSR